MDESHCTYSQLLSSSSDTLMNPHGHHGFLVETQKPAWAPLPQCFRDGLQRNASWRKRVGSLSVLTPKKTNQWLAVDVPSGAMRRDDARLLTRLGRPRRGGLRICDLRSSKTITPSRPRSSACLCFIRGIFSNMMRVAEGTLPGKTENRLEDASLARDTALNSGLEARVAYLKSSPGRADMQLRPVELGH